MEKSIYTREYAAVTQLLKVLRKEAGMTQVELGEVLGQSQSFVTKFERGERRLDIVQLRTLCHKLGVTLPQFVKRLEAALAKSK
jgi:transcriptional regulator with XRE-family HTH domain